MRSCSAQTVYLNNAASSWPKAPGVADAVQKALESPPYHPGRSVNEVPDPLGECRARLARILSITDPQRIVLTCGATHALNQAILGTGLTSRFRVITTAVEHNSVLRPLFHLQKRLGIEIDIIGLDKDGAIDTDAFESALRLEPKLVAINHQSNVTGRITDVAPLFARAKQAGATTLLDASQSLGHIQVHPLEMHADMVAFTGHKGLHGPSGTGGLYISPDVNLEQILVGGTGVRSDLKLHPEDMPMRLEAGTPDIPGFVGLAVALKWIEERGEEHEANRGYMASRLRDNLAEIGCVRFYNKAHSPIISFKLDNWDVEETGYVLGESFGIICRTGLHCAPLIHKEISSAPEGTVRFSVSGFNTPQDIDQAAEAVRRLAA